MTDCACSDRPCLFHFAELSPADREAWRQSLGLVVREDHGGRWKAADGSGDSRTRKHVGSKHAKGRGRPEPDTPADIYDHRGRF